MIGDGSFKLRIFPCCIREKAQRLFDGPMARQCIVQDGNHSEPKDATSINNGDIMFKDEITPMCATNFGVGSTVEAGHERWLVVGSATTDTCMLLNLETMVVGAPYRVADRNFLTQREARELVGSLPMFTFSDFTLNAKGMKGM
jgi:hypothetical protein